MVDIADLQAFLEKIQGGTIPVDLLKIGQSHYAQYANAGKFSQRRHFQAPHICMHVQK